MCSRCKCCGATLVPVISPNALTGSSALRFLRHCNTLNPAPAPAPAFVVPAAAAAAAAVAVAVAVGAAAAAAAAAAEWGVEAAEK